MKDSRTRIVTKVMFFFLDLFIFSSAFYFLIKKQYELNFSYVPTFTQLIDAHYKAYFIIIIFWIIIANTTKLYYLDSRDSFYKTIYATILQVVLLIPVIFTVSGLKSTPLFSNKSVLILSAFIFFISLALRLLYRVIFVSKQNYNYLFIGSNKASFTLKKHLNQNKSNNIYEIHDFKEISKDNFIKSLKDNKINKIILVDSDLVKMDNVKYILNICEDFQIDINFIPISFDHNYVNYDLDFSNGIQLLRIRRYPLDKDNNKYAKLLVDKLISLFVCIFIMSWLYPLLAILIKLDSKGPVIFKQKRTGINGESFDCYKFRTMKSDGTNSIKATVINDNRITKLGNFLRKSSLDEFPQFFNVLKGNMSIIGPRPHMLTVDDQYSKIVNRYYFRYYVKPGITGLSQVSGYRGDMTDENMNDRIRTDIFYIKNWSMTLDIKILIKTFTIIFKGDKNAI